MKNDFLVYGGNCHSFHFRSYARTFSKVVEIGASECGQRMWAANVGRGSRLIRRYNWRLALREKNNKNAAPPTGKACASRIACSRLQRTRLNGQRRGQESTAVEDVANKQKSGEASSSLSRGELGDGFRALGDCVPGEHAGEVQTHCSLNYTGTARLYFALPHENLGLGCGAREARGGKSTSHSGQQRAPPPLHAANPPSATYRRCD